MASIRSWARVAPVVTLAVAIASSTTLGQANEERLEIDTERSAIEVFAPTIGLLSGLAHDHSIGAGKFSGVIVRDVLPERSCIELEISTSGLVLLDPKLSMADRKQVRENMRSADVLHVKKYPRVTFRSHETVLGGTDEEGRRRITVTGDLSLHGKTRTVALEAVLADRGSEVEVVGEHTIRQTDFGITPYSLALGTIRMKNEVTIRFHLIARIPGTKDSAAEDAGDGAEQGDERHGGR